MSTSPLTFLDIMRKRAPQLIIFTIFQHLQFDNRRTQEFGTHNLRYDTKFAANQLLRLVHPSRKIFKIFVISVCANR